MGVPIVPHPYKKQLSEEMFLLGDTTMIPLNWKLRLPAGHFGLLMPLNQQAKKRVTVLARMTDLDFQGEVGELYKMEVEEEGIHISFPPSLFELEHLTSFSPAFGLGFRKQHMLARMQRKENTLHCWWECKLH
ncbi:unnamed protein product [Nyctereutes procyonoides]|uniref:(raccoon dog) hypothetical protein n=1 Tax=Nyctereutes procyonoides TaxID=34880 RepID=A0A811XVD4_NYCPR|nr:unnamed protein product [Nyctereutes procyonoides]